MESLITDEAAINTTVPATPAPPAHPPPLIGTPVIDPMQEAESELSADLV